MTKFFLTMLLAVFLVSCDLLLDLNDILDPNAPLESDQFYAVDFTKETYYKVRAKKLWEGERCVIWAENSSGVTQNTAKEIADKYDTVIRPKIVDAFGMKNITVEDKTFDDILDYANWLADKSNKKLTILLLNIKDNFNGTKNTSYVAGYFFSGNFRPRNTDNSNGCDMIYVDTYPGLSDKYPDQKPQTYSTFAHELQHLINYATTTLKRTDSTGRLIPMDTWIDEGLSSQAEHIYFGDNIKTLCTQFTSSKTIAKGNNFFVWGNNPEAILDEYSTVYLFFRWLYLQANNNLRPSIFLDIETSNLSDHEIITSVAKKIRPEWADWEVLLRSWFAANYNPANSNYGYKDSFFHTRINVQTIKTTDNKISLYPGEGVYSNINNSFSPPAGGANIRYAGISDNSSNIATQAPLKSKVMLTFNANTNNKSKTETGSLTGVSAGVSSIPNSRIAAEDAQAETHTGPYVIDARDYAGILGRNK